MMRVLADENIDRPIVLWLREQGHDVVEVTATSPGESDANLVDQSRADKRILMSFDRDIGRIVWFDGLPHPGVIYLRLRGEGPELWDVLKRVWPSVEPVCANHFVTVRNTQVRCRALPMRGDQ